MSMIKYIVLPFMAIAALICVLIVAANAQEFYYPVGNAKADKEVDSGFWCLTRDEIATGAKLLGVDWTAEPGSLTLLKGDGGTVLIDFVGACASSAKVVR